MVEINKQNKPKHSFFQKSEERLLEMSSIQLAVFFIAQIRSSLGPQDLLIHIFFLVYTLLSVSHSQTTSKPV